MLKRMVYLDFPLEASEESCRATKMSNVVKNSVVETWVESTDLISQFPIQIVETVRLVIVNETMIYWKCSLEAWKERNQAPKYHCRHVAECFEF